MTINDPKAYVASLWDWGCLDGCFGETKVKPTDIDGEVERNGQFLDIETKLPNVEVPLGQMITFKRKIDAGIFTIMVVWGHPGKPEEILLMTKNTTREYKDADLEVFRKIVNAWWEWAETQTPAPRFSF